MYKFVNLGNEAKQEVTKMLEDGSLVKFTFEFKPNQLGWFFGFKYEDTNYQNIRLVTSYNLLRAYKNYLPFGLRCDTLDNEEPMDLNDFASGYATLYLLTPADVEAIEGNYYVKTPTEL